MKVVELQTQFCLPKLFFFITPLETLPKSGPQKSNFLSAIARALLFYISRYFDIVWGCVIIRLIFICRSAFLVGTRRLIFEFLLFAIGKSPIFWVHASAVATGGCAPYFGLLKIPFLEHHPTTRQQTMMENGIITFKHNSRLAFSRFVAITCCA